MLASGSNRWPQIGVQDDFEVGHARIQLGNAPDTRSPLPQRPSGCSAMTVRRPDSTSSTQPSLRSRCL